MKNKIIKVNDTFQKNYQYEITEPIGMNFDSEFKPYITPQEMLELGVFGGVYFSFRQSILIDAILLKINEIKIL